MTKLRNKNAKAGSTAAKLLALAVVVALGSAFAAVASYPDRMARDRAERLSESLEDNVELAQAQEFIDTSKPFNHESHLGKKATEKNGGSRMKCEECHQGMVDEKGQCPSTEVRFPTHETCAKCHAANFYTAPLTICGSCHKSAEFKKGNPLKDLGRIVTPRKSAFNHKQHLIAKGSARKKTGKRLDCTSCHKPKKKGKIVTNPSHNNCCQCHTDDKLDIQMKNCSSCHSAAKGATRRVEKIHSFTHAKHHMMGKEGNSMRCAECHVNGHMAKTLKQIKTPPMSACVNCHDGNHSWHFSSCLKCHKEGTMSGPIPASHKMDTPSDDSKKLMTPLKNETGGEANLDWPERAKLSPPGDKKTDAPKKDEGKK